MTDTDDLVPWLVDPGWGWSAIIPNLGGDNYRVLFYEDAARTVRFEHRCNRGVRGVVICAPALQNAHRIEQLEPLTISPSILCPDCGIHGFVRNGRWVQA